MNIYDKIRSGETINQQLEDCILSIYRDNDFIVFKYDFRDHKPAFTYRMPIKKLDEIEEKAQTINLTGANNQLPIN